MFDMHNRPKNKRITILYEYLFHYLIAPLLLSDKMRHSYSSSKDKK